MVGYEWYPCSRPLANVSCLWHTVVGGTVDAFNHDEAKRDGSMLKALDDTCRQNTHTHKIYTHTHTHTHTHTSQVWWWKDCEFKEILIYVVELILQTN